MATTALADPAPTEGASAFQDMLVYVYQQNPRIQSERQALKVEDEHVSESNANFRPTLNANGDLGRQRVQTSGEDWIYGTARDEALIFNQPLFNGGGTFAQFHAARARVSAERAHLTAVEEQVFLDAISAYLEVVTRQYILVFNRDNRTHLQGYMNSADKRLQAGDGTKTDVALAQSRVEQSAAIIANSQASWNNACATYKRITGLEVPSSAFPAFPESLPGTLEETVALAQNAPEFSQAAEQDRAAAHDVDAASSSFWPTVSLRGTMSDSLSPTLGLQNLRNDSVTLNLSFPLYQGGTEYAHVREAAEVREKTHDDMMDTSRFITERANQAWYNYQAGVQVIDSTRRTVEAANRALQGVEAEQQQGLRTMQDTLDARAELINSLIAEVQAEENARLQAYRLLAATGQLTAASMHLPTPLYDKEKHYNEVANAWTGLK
jgi:outer membrane protein